MFILFDIVFIFLAIIYLPVMLIRGKWHVDFLKRFGIFSREEISQLKAGKNIWVHAVSVGEILAVVGLIEQIKKKFPSYRIVLTTVTQTGYVLAHTKIKFPDIVLFAPLDFSWVVRKYIRVINPKINIIAETEIWPNLLYSLDQARVPVVIVNGRISDKSFKKYQIFRFLLKPVLRGIKVFAMQSQLDAQRIELLGALPERIRLVGNVKFDAVNNNIKIRPEDIGLTADEQILVAGSTHPGEEEILLDFYKELKDEFPRLKLILVPRHIERSGEVAQLVSQKGFTPVLLSKKGKTFHEDFVLVVDTIGQLSSLYSIATVVFVGKTISAIGGQNMIEPAAYGKAVVVGPHTENFKDVMSILLNDQAIVQVSDKNELKKAIEKCLSSKDFSSGLGSRAQKAVLNQRGATERIVKLLEPFIS